MKVKVWRNKVSAMKPVWGQEAPLADLDGGNSRYVLIEATGVTGVTATFVRGYDDSTATSFADVLEEAVPPLAMAGYTGIKCLGGGYAIYEVGDKKVLLKGESCGFGPADHAVAAAVLRSYFGSEFSVTDG
jgi:hypothetical protein